MKKQQLSLSIALVLGTVGIALTGCGGGGGGTDDTDGSDTAAFDKMVDSEMLFNPTVNANSDQAKQYLNGKLGTSGSLTSAEAEALNTSIADALSVDSDHPFKATAAVVNKVVTSNSYDVTVTTEDITAQKFVKKDLQLNPQKATWTESHSDEDPRAIVVLDSRNLVVVATDEYNYLYVIDTNSAEIKSQRHFAGVEGPRFTIDAVTGASEHGLRDIKAAPDGSSVYISVRPDNGDDSVGNAQDDRYGLFRVVIDDAGESFAHDDPSSKRYDSANIGKFHVAADGKIFMEDTDADIIHILDADLNDTGNTLAQPADIEAHRTFLTDDTIYISTRAVEADPDATPPVVAESAKLHKIDGQTGTTTASMDIEVSPDGLVIFDDGKQALIYEEDLYAAILDLTTMTETHRLPLSEDQGQHEIETATVTKDGHYAILAGHDNEQLWFFDLTLPVSRMEKLTPTDTRIRALATDDNGQIYAGGRTGFVDFFNPVAGNVITPQQAVTQDVATVVGENLNRGLPLSVIVTDLNLPIGVPGGGGSVISWGTTVSSIDTATGETLGAVTRPAGQDETGTLTATANYVFRDISTTDSKGFDVNVRKQPNMLTAAGNMELIGDLTRVSPDAVIANADGSKVALQLKMRDDESKTHGGLVLAKVDAAGSLVPLSGTLDPITQQVNGYIAFEPEEYGVGGLFRDNTVVSVTNTGRILSHTVNDVDGVLTLSNTIDDLPVGEIKRVGYSWDERYMGILIGQNLENDDDADDNFLMVVYDLNDITSITHKNDIQMGNPFTEYSGGFPRVAVGENGDSMFMRSGDGRIVLSRFDVGGNGIAAKTAPPIEGEVTWALVARGDELLFGTFNGNVHSIHKDLDLATMKKFYTGFSGRTTVMYLRDNKLHVFIRGVGQITFDASNFSDLKEVDFLERPDLQYGGVSLDGMRSFAFGVSGRNDDPQYSRLEYVELP